ncbi:MAG: HU family DNA-binding protein [Eubacteriales bacterium]|nr:HU family DNA-binding protein [Eubacteriales bacterium]
MKKAEFVSIVAAQTGMTKKDTECALDAICRSLADALAQGDRVTLPGIGTFAVKQRPAREGHLPSTGERIDIPATNIPIFRPAKQLKEKVNT